MPAALTWSACIHTYSLQDNERGNFMLGDEGLKHKRKGQSRIGFLLWRSYMAAHILEERLGRG